MAVMATELYIVEVDDACFAELAGHTGCAYASPPQSETQARGLIRALLGCAPQAMAGDGPWRRAIAGGIRTVHLHRASANGQILL